MLSAFALALRQLTDPAVLRIVAKSLGVTLLAPVIGAAMATHLVHRKGTMPHAA